MKKRILFIILFLLLFLLISISIIYFVFSNNGKETVTNKQESAFLVVESEEIGKSREFLGLEFSNGKVEYNGEKSKYSVTITNNTSKDIELGKYNVVFKNKENEVVGVFVGYVKDIIQNGDSISPTIESNVDLSQAYTLEYQEYIDGEIVDQKNYGNTSVVSSKVVEDNKINE